MPPTITIIPWTDPILARSGHDPRSRYVETFWLPTLGPTAVLLLRHLAARFDLDPAGVELPVAMTSRALGLGARDGTTSPIVRTLQRLVQFGLACEDGRGSIAVRRLLPTINPRHVRRLPEPLQHEHARWLEANTPLDVSATTTTAAATTSATPPAAPGAPRPRPTPRATPRRAAHPAHPGHQVAPPPAPPARTP